MTQHHPDLPVEQQYIDHAYRCLERSRDDAWKLHEIHEGTLGGTFQARYERDVFDEAMVTRLTKLDLGDSALVFGRIDRIAPDDLTAENPQRAGYAGTATGTRSGAGEEIESFHIGRLAVADELSDPVVVDWRAPVAEPFYRATGKDPMGLVRRRHFSVQGRQLLGIEDELFGEGHLGVDNEDLEGAPAGGVPGSGLTRSSLRGYSTLLSALQRGRTGQLGDIVATIQAEQDAIIRSPQPGVLVVQGGPGTGKTVVALHRAAYLLYTYRFPLEDQGVLVIGPNRVFLRYIERVLPSLGEAGIEQVVLGDLVSGVRWARTDDDPAESAATARVKGDPRMSLVIDQAVTDRERPLRDDLVVPFRTGFLRFTVADSQRVVRAAQRRFRRHNAARKFVEQEIWTTMANGWRDADLAAREVRAAVRSEPDVRAALERMWPVLAPADLLHDLFGSKALLKLAAHRHLTEDEYLALYRPRATDVSEVRFSEHDVALLDEARSYLGSVPERGPDGTLVDDDVRTYGHIVVDEVQDLTPMQLRMVARRSLNGSMTVVGDLAQATGAFAPATWDDVLAFLPDVKAPRVVGLSVGYRIPAQIMELANKVMAAATPSLRAPNSVRMGDAAPRVTSAEPGALLGTVAAEVGRLVREIGDGNLAVVCPDPMVEAVSKALADAGVDHGRARRNGLDMGVTVVPVSVIKGLELDGVVVVEPAHIVSDEPQGLRALYVALTRSTRRLTVVHSQPLPAAMA